MHGYYWNDGGWFGPWMMFGWFFSLLFVGGVVALLVRGSSSWRRELSGPTDDAEDILRRRYAKGEIDDAELHHRLDELRHAAGPA